jgi:hypothetical protein
MTPVHITVDAQNVHSLLLHKAEYVSRGTVGYVRTDHQYAEWRHNPAPLAGEVCPQPVLGWSTPKSSSVPTDKNEDD